MTWRLKDKQDKTQLVADLSLVSESVDLNLVLFAFFRKVHPCLLPCAYYSFGRSDIEEHGDAGSAVPAFLCLQLKCCAKLSLARLPLPGHSKTAGALIVFAKQQYFSSKS